MSDIEELIPPHEPSQDTFAFAVRTAASLIPMVGPLAAETLAHALETRQAQRQYDFNVAVAKAITSNIASSESEISVEDIVRSDEFIAAITRAQRAAAETASASKRARLAAAVANSGSWAPFSESERGQFARLLEDLDELHIWLLHYFVDPAAWLKHRGMYEQHANVYMGGISGPLATALGQPEQSWHEPVKQASADLERAGLASIPLGTTMSADGIFSPRTSHKGVRFLAYIAESDSTGAAPPATI